ncbi:NPC intracellular cholesterol transporter 2-like isoform X2 [Lineus longissimus]|uniref:NPC intracellular cholesterol transporter 2-like isoform X2 n=1 Tax=Lineus longissimus TaxID=88925 RepID=UPI002B4EAA56
MKSILAYFVLVLCLSAIMARKLNFRPRYRPRLLGDSGMIWHDCVSPGSVLESVDISPWESSDGKAVMIQGKSYNFTVVFKATKDATDAVTHAYGQLGPVPRIEWPLPHPDACGDPIGTVTCPLKKGTTYTYRKNVHVSTYYPPYQYLAYWELHNENDEKIFCVVFPLTIRSRWSDNTLSIRGKTRTGDDFQSFMQLLSNKPFV